MEFTLTFIHYFFWAIILISPLLVLFSSILVALGLLVGRIEGWNRFDAIYWSLITAMTVGYGDIKPSKKSSKVLSIIITFIGIMLFGIVVAITVNTASKAFQQHADLSSIQEINEKLKNTGE
jgi:voltage-gated potassium channel